MLPNFFIVGAAKAGTSSLWHYLDEHPQVKMSKIKEPNYFAYEELMEQNLFWNDIYINKLTEYLSLFNNKGDAIAIGEASVSYLFYKNVPSRIKNKIPNAKIIIVLRNPIERGFSHYLMDHSTSKVNISYEDIVYRKFDSNIMDIYYQQYVSLGLYYEQVKRYIDVFGIESVKIIFNHDLKLNQEKTLREIFTFLNIDSNFLPNFSIRHNANKSPKNMLVRKIYSYSFLRNIFSNILNNTLKEFFKSLLFSREKKMKMSPEMIEYLKKIYTPDIVELEKLLNIDLSEWKI